MRKYCLAGLAAVAAAGILAVFPAYAHDIEWGIRHGEQDALVLGTVKEAGEDWVVLDGVIPLDSDNTATIYRQLEPDQIPETMKVTNIQPYAMSYHDRSLAGAGDHMMVSADRDGSRWRALYRPYEVSSMNTATLKFLPEERKNRDSAAWEAFVHSGGVYSDFSFGNGRVYVKVTGNDGAKENVALFDENAGQGAVTPEQAAAAPAADLRPPAAPALTAAPGPPADPALTAAPGAPADPALTAVSGPPAAPALTAAPGPPAAPALTTSPAPSQPASTSSHRGISPLALGFLWGGAGFAAAFIFSRRNKK